MVPASGLRSLRPEVVELAKAGTTEEGVPFGWGEAQDRPRRILAVADADDSFWEVSHLDARAVGEAERALHPDRARVLSLGHCCHHLTDHLRMLDQNGRQA